MQDLSTIIEKSHKIVKLNDILEKKHQRLEYLQGQEDTEEIDCLEKKIYEIESEIINLGYQQ